MSIPSGTRVGSYQVAAQLGAGGMGVVYRAVDTRLHRDVALKFLHASEAADPDSRGRLLAEARAAAALRHPNICVVHDVAEHDGQPFIAMELVGGSTLDDVIGRGGLDWDRIVDIGLQIADALGHAHRAGLVHRDLKGANVMIDTDGRVKVLDFGLALHGAVGLTEATRSRDPVAGHVAGTLAYMAPEVLRGEGSGTQRADIWALGVMLHHMAAGERPFHGSSGYDLTSAILRDPPRPLPAGVPAPLAAVIKRCLSKDDSRRYASMDEVRAALEVASQPPRPQPAPQRQSVAATGTRRWRLGAIVAAALAAIIGLIVWQVPRAPTDPSPGITVERLVVLPFENLSGDASQDFFSEGMTDEVTTRLATLTSVAVISRTSAMAFNDRKTPLAEVGKRLGVQAVVEGSVLKAGDRVRITVRLVDVASDRHLWAGSFDRAYRDVLALQSDIASAVAQHVRAELAPVPAAMPLPLPGNDPTTPPTPTATAVQQVNPAAYEKYLLGRHFVQQRNAESAAKGVEYLREAAELEPESAIVHAALANAYREYDTWSGVGIGASAENIRAEASRAIALDARLSEAHFALGQVLYWYDWDWAGAQREFLAALAANPSLAEAHMSRALVLQTLGDDPGAVEAGRRATALEPLSPAQLSDFGRILYRARRYNEAIEQFSTALQLDPGFVPALYRLADARLMLGDLPGFQSAVSRTESAGAKVPLQNLRALRAIGLAAEGRAAEARAIAREIEAASSSDHPGEYAFTLATVFATLGDAETSLTWLETGIAHRAMYPLQLRDPQLSRVQQEPRYVALLQRLGMQP